MAVQNLPIHFHFADITFSFPRRTTTKKIISELIISEGKEVASLNYIFCSDAYLLQLNEGYLSHSTLTDIITFHYHTEPEPIHSDIYISIERVKENAYKFSVPFIHELYRVFFHGALHLCGYKDKTKKEALLMRSREEFYLQYFNVSRETKTKKYKVVPREKN